jgi:voltage-gated potassium channel
MVVSWLREIIEPSVQNRASQAFDLTMQALILVGTVSFSVETLPDLSAATLSVLHYIDVFVVAVFTVEYGLRLVVAERRIRFIFSFYGLIDLLAILPFYISLGVDLRSLRILRFFRVFRALKLFRYSRALHHFVQALETVKEQFALYLMATALMVYFAAAGVYYFEHEAQPDQFKSIFHSLWWSVVTLTSVGYGDIYPITTGGRIFTGLLLPLGLGVITVPSGLLAYGLMHAHAQRMRQDFCERPVAESAAYAARPDPVEADPPVLGS